MLLNLVRWVPARGIPASTRLSILHLCARTVMATARWELGLFHSVLDGHQRLFLDAFAEDSFTSDVGKMEQNVVKYGHGAPKSFIFHWFYKVLCQVMT